ncbi:hypothetical protein [Streptomyces cinnamoneus]|uniref:TFIIB-type zinc ribbon-containing protein n=1 Tax=Streptomyces cinnamoneus TaxID=53446 RepID=A0A918TTZ9_STRCJ|nr:hypothetical protein [Streptomyces cinnamoneus]GHC59958.1 hypothetical protein GCM10010507_41150 [Streptomyces cinnamoneus]
MTVPSAPPRFKDPHLTSYTFLTSVLVRCPRCAAPARIGPLPEAAHGGQRRVVCPGCGLSRRAGRGPVFRYGPGPAVDPWFGFPLWLQARTRHGVLWAYNLEHLDLIRRFVAASLRERAPWYETGRKMTAVARLPAWAQRAGNRGEVLRAIDRARGTLLH